MAEWQATGDCDGRLTLSAYSRQNFKEYLRLNAPVRLVISTDLPESGKLRRYYEGSIIPLIAFYQEGMDHRSSDDRLKIREWLKLEFNGEVVEIGGRAQTVGKTTKGAMLAPFVERVIDWLTENYAPPAEALDPERYKYWRDTVYLIPGGADNYLDYLVETGILKTSNT